MGNPVTGSKPMLMLILIINWIKNIRPKPKIKSRPKSFLVWLIILKKRQNIKRYKIKIATIPKKPNSSAKDAKIKSASETGRK